MRLLPAALIGVEGNVSRFPEAGSSLGTLGGDSAVTTVVQPPPPGLTHTLQTTTSPTWYAAPVWLKSLSFNS